MSFLLVLTLGSETVAKVRVKALPPRGTIIYLAREANLDGQRRNLLSSRDRVGCKGYKVVGDPRILAVTTSIYDDHDDYYEADFYQVPVKLSSRP